MDAKALVMLSGGLDSATCLWWAKSKFSAVSAITFNYFGRVEKEKQATAKLAKKAGVANLIKIDLPFVKEASDFYDGHFKRLASKVKAKNKDDSRWSSYVPARNIMFYSIAAYYAEYLGIGSIIGGHNLHDMQFFKDASKGYIKKINSLFKQGCLFCKGQPYQILLPLADMNRKEIVNLAIKLKTPIELTWSCHNDGRVHCGQCYACKQRLEAFSSMGLADPVFVLHAKVSC